jgi:hypothetical protein
MDIIFNVLALVAGMFKKVENSAKVFSDKQEKKVNLLKK